MHWRRHSHPGLRPHNSSITPLGEVYKSDGSASQSQFARPGHCPESMQEMYAARRGTSTGVYEGKHGKGYLNKDRAGRG
jgi:hypothetical protein